MPVPASKPPSAMLSPGDDRVNGRCAVALWRVRVDVPDEPGRLAGLAAAVRGGGGNILTFEVHRRDDGQVTYELVVDLPATRQVAGLVTAARCRRDRGAGRSRGPARARRPAHPPRRGHGSAGGRS